MRPLLQSSLPLAVAIALVSASPTSASTIAIGSGAFGPGSTLTTFNGQTNLAEVNGLTVDGILFSYSLGNGSVFLDGGPGVTNNIAPLNIVSIGTGSNTGVLSMFLPQYSSQFGFGFALLTNQVLASAVTISIFDGATFLGALVYGSSPDPTFTGGFAGIQSTVPFNNVQIVFNSTQAAAFALDNIQTSAAVPEPATLLLLGSGLGAVAARRRLRKRT